MFGHELILLLYLHIVAAFVVWHMHWKCMGNRRQPLEHLWACMELTQTHGMLTKTNMGMYGKPMGTCGNMSEIH